jgi:hypothetical protein
MAITPRDEGHKKSVISLIKLPHTGSKSGFWVQADHLGFGVKTCFFFLQD